MINIRGIDYVSRELQTVFYGSRVQDSDKERIDHWFETAFSSQSTGQIKKHTTLEHLFNGSSGYYRPHPCVPFAIQSQGSSLEEVNKLRTIHHRTRHFGTFLIPKSRGLNVLDESESGKLVGASLFIRDSNNDVDMKFIIPNDCIDPFNDVIRLFIEKEHCDEHKEVCNRTNSLGIDFVSKGLALASNNGNVGMPCLETIHGYEATHPFLMALFSRIRMVEYRLGNNSLLHLLEDRIDGFVGQEGYFFTLRK